MDIRPPSESDGESSDGDYFPNEEEDEEEDDFSIDADADFEFEVDEMDLELDMDEIWEDGGMEDEESWADEETTFSEANMSLTSELDALAEDGADFVSILAALKMLTLIQLQTIHFAMSKAPTRSNSCS